MRRHMIVAALVTACLGTVGYQHVMSQAGEASLTGVVTSEAEGSMEGVLVSAKAVGSTVRVTVVTDRQGRYVFPRERLAPGRYQLSIRATGYDRKDPGLAEVTANKVTALNLQLQKAADVGAQLMNAEWIASWPGTTEEKQYASGCVACHSLEPIMRSRHDARQWLAVPHACRCIRTDPVCSCRSTPRPVRSTPSIWARMRHRRSQPPPATWTTRVSRAWSLRARPLSPRIWPPSIWDRIARRRHGRTP